MAEEWRVDKPLYIRVSDERKRSLEQNDKLHAECRDLVNQGIEWGGRTRTVDEWKQLFVSAYQAETGQPVEVVQGLLGEVAMLNPHTSNMGVEQLSELIEFIQAWRAENDH